MADKDYFEKIADKIALHNASEVTPDQLRRQVIMALKEVERDTRHKAAEIANSLSKQIYNMRPSA